MAPVVKMFLTTLMCICFCALRCNGSTISAPSTKAKEPFFFDWRLALAGGLAGGLANAIMYPIDTIKTMRQTDSKGLQNSLSALQKLRKIGLSKIYSGFAPAVLGSIPSSALYFGSYETMKSYLNYNFENSTVLGRQARHVIAAASGNFASSLIFVPKDAIKQQMQVIKTGLIEYKGPRLPSGEIRISTLQMSKDIFKREGVKGFYPNYRATLLRNIPSAMIRFTLYEELRILAHKCVASRYETLGYLVAGTISSACSSAFTTPFDVVKTRLATGVLPKGSPVLKSIWEIGRTEGVSGLYAGLHARLIWSGLFGGIGFTCFEACKKIFLEQMDSEIKGVETDRKGLLLL